MNYQLLDFFFHPVLRSTTIGSMLMGSSIAMVGAILLVQRRSLLGEALSHAAYPGALAAPFILFWLGIESGTVLSIAVFLGAFIFCGYGLRAITRYQKTLQLHPDVALSLVSTLFLGIGILLASRLQFMHPLFYQQLSRFLYGQVATITDVEVVVYGLFTLFCSSLFFTRLRQLELRLFDPQFGKNIASQGGKIDRLLFFLLLLAVVFGIESVGVILFSGMLVAPAISARQLTDRFSRLIPMAACFGCLAAFLGNVLAIYLPLWLGKEIALPIGPTIVITSAAFTLLILLFAPTKGFFPRMFRIGSFRLVCLGENVLKTLWKNGDGKRGFSLVEMQTECPCRYVLLVFVLFFLRITKKVRKEGSTYRLLPKGFRRASQLVRLHRLWELYLTSHLDMDCHRVHASAEEIEHLLTPDLEKQLTLLLNDPKLDPHSQPIPKWEEVRS